MAEALADRSDRFPAVEQQAGVEVAEGVAAVIANGRDSARDQRLSAIMKFPRLVGLAIT
jgi:hypothetical protein